MKKLINISFIYCIFGLLSGVFYREFTRFYNFLGETTLSRVHTHILSLGMIMFLIFSIFNKLFNIEENKYYKYFLLFYIFGLNITVSTMIFKGIIQVLNLEISKNMAASISGISGIGHIFITIGLVLFFYILKNINYDN